MKRLIAALAALLLTSPVLAYTIYLEDGSRIVAAEKYRVEGDRAIIQLPSGTETFLSLDEIDVERTREANRQDYGDAVVVEDGEVRRTPTAAAERREERSLSDVAARRDLSEPIRDPARATRDDRAETARGSPGESAARNDVPLTPAGNVDLLRFSGSELADADLQERIEQLFANRGVQRVTVARGTTEERVFLRFTTDSEAAVFRALAASAQALLALRDAASDRPPLGFELLMVTTNGSRAGQFYLTAESARELVRGDLTISEFYLQRVLF